MTIRFNMFKKIALSSLFFFLYLVPTFSYATHVKVSSTHHTNTITQIEQQTTGLNPKVLRMGLHAYKRAQAQGLVKTPYLTIIDYSLGSKQKRFWVIDLAHKTVPFHTYVSHGKNSGKFKASHFSNRYGSKQSSIGVFVTQNTYIGHKGYSLRLNGLEKNINDHAKSRAIVVHGAWYAEPWFVHHFGRTGLSWGCPALPASQSRKIIRTIKNGSVVFSYYPNKNYLSHSKYLV